MLFRITIFWTLFGTLLLFTVQVNAQAHDQGRELFTRKTLGGGTNGKTCLTCHKKGRDFSEDTLKKQHFTVMGIEINGLPEVINFCIEVALRGEGLNPEGEEMKALIAYLEIFIKKNTVVKNL